MGSGAKGGRDNPAVRELLLTREVLVGDALTLARGALERGVGVIFAGCTLWTGEMLNGLRIKLAAPVIHPAQVAVMRAVSAARTRSGVRTPAGAA